MPSRKTTKAAVAWTAALPKTPKELINQLVTGPMSAEAVADLSTAFKNALIERALSAELSHHLGYQPGSAKSDDEVNHRDGTIGKRDLKARGVADILIAVMDGLKGIDEALGAVYPDKML